MAVVAVGSGSVTERARFSCVFVSTRTGWAARVIVENNGTYPAPVILEVRGNSAEGWTATGPQGALAVVTAPITPGQTHRYDGDTGLLTINGVAQVIGVARSDRLEIPTGAYPVEVNNGCEIRVHYAPTWAP